MSQVKRMSPSLTPPRPTPLRPTLLKLEKLKRKPQRRNVRIVSTKGMFLRSNTIIATRRAIIPSTTPKQKTNDSFDNSQKLYNMFPILILGLVQGDKITALTDIDNNDNSTLKTYGMVIASILL